MTEERAGTWQMYPCQKCRNSRMVIDGKCSMCGAEQPAQAVPRSQSPDYETCTHQNGHPQWCKCGAGDGEGISAEQLAVDICRELYDRFVMGGWEPVEAHDYIKDILQAYAGELRKERDALKRQNEWIPVSERLPEPNWYGLIYSTEANIETAYFRRDPIGIKSMDTYWQLERTAPQDETIRLELEQVTHWRPLPNPPGERQEPVDTKEKK